jgi:hypothetical protein
MIAGIAEPVGNILLARENANAAEAEIYEPLMRLFCWLEKNAYRGYDTFDGLEAKYIRPFAFENRYLLIVLQQGVRRFPINLRPFLGVEKEYSSKAMGFFARGFLKLFAATGNPIWADRAKSCLQWLIQNQSAGYSGPCWGNHFDYVSRSGRIPKNVPSVVWTSLIGHAFLDAYDHFRNEEYLQIAVNICTHILHDLTLHSKDGSAPIGYTPGGPSWVHNSNTLGAGFLSRTFSYTGNEEYRQLAKSAMNYTVQHQRSNGSWFYGVKSNLHWVDNFHTGYVLDSLKQYEDGTGDHAFSEAALKGYGFWKRTFFLSDGTPRYYDYKTLPLDIQCSSQAIDTLLFFSDRDPEALQLAARIALWTIANMQDRSGYFYYRRYSRWVVNKTPTLHWGQATMFSALAGLYRSMCNDEKGQ